MQLTQEHQELRRNLTKFIDNEINPTSRNGKQQRFFRLMICLRKWAIWVFLA